MALAISVTETAKAVFYRNGPLLPANTRERTDEYILRVGICPNPVRASRPLTGSSQSPQGEVHADGRKRCRKSHLHENPGRPGSTGFREHRAPWETFRAENVREVLVIISMIHQELLMVPELTIAENLFLEKKHVFKRWITISRPLRERASELLARVGSRFLTTRR